MQKILIIDFGSQYTQLIARRVREQNIYCEIHPFSKFSEFVSEKYILLSGDYFYSYILFSINYAFYLLILLFIKLNFGLFFIFFNSNLF